MFFLQNKTINKQTMLKDFPQENLRLCTQNSNSVEKLTSKEQTTNYRSTQNSNNVEKLISKEKTTNFIHKTRRKTKEYNKIK